MQLTPPENATTLMQALDGAAARIPERIAYRLLKDGDNESECITFFDLRTRALRLAERLIADQAFAKPAILLYPQGIEFIVAFLACLYAGAIAVPVAFPKRKRGYEALRRIAGDVRASLLLTCRDSSSQPELSRWAAENELAWFDTRDFGVECLPAALSTEPPEVAFLQYTSGATAAPRGVIITHANLVSNHRQITESLGSDTSTIYVSWLPMFHDMGLAIALQAIWNGATCVLMPPHAFVEEPRRWLSAISRYRATCSGGPDSAFELCTRRISQEAKLELDLSCWKVAFNGSELVRPSTLEQFARVFSGNGFRPDAFHPVYGLAEATALVSSEPPELLPIVTQFDRDALQLGRAIRASDSATIARRLVSFGRPLQGQSLVVVDPETRAPCSTGRVGEIWIRGSNVGTGYVSRDAETKSVFGALLDGSCFAYLRSGDLGFLHDGRLYVVGRLQDRIPLGKKCQYSPDLEATASTCYPAFVPYACAVFTAQRDTSWELVVVQEIARTALRNFDASAAVDSIRSALRREHQVEVDAIALIRPATLPRTTSGKVRRNDCRTHFVEGSLNALHEWRSPRLEPTLDKVAQGFAPVAPGAERLIEWLRRHAAGLIAYHAGSDARRSLDTHLPDALLRDFAQQGLLSMPIERAYGGLEFGYADTLRVLEQLAAVDFHCAVVVGLNAYLGVFPIARYGSDTMKRWLLPGLAQGSEVAAMACAEPGQFTQLRARVRRSESHDAETDELLSAAPGGQNRTQHGILSGKKYLEGSIGTPTIVNVLVGVDDSKATDAFVVCSKKISEQCLGGPSSIILLDGMTVAHEQRLGTKNQGTRIVEQALSLSHLATAAASVGAMKRCAQWVSRATPPLPGLFGTSTPNPITLARLMSVKARVTALECLVQGLARYLDLQQTAPAEAFAACRFFGPQLLLWTIDDFMQLGVALSPADMDRLLTLHRVASRLRMGNDSPDTFAEEIGALVIEGGHSLRKLLVEVFPAEAATQLIDVAVESIRLRMLDLNAALARRPQRWARTRAGQLGFWIILLGAVESERTECSSPDLSRAHAWAAAQFEQALASVRVGTPSEAATAESLDVQGLFAGYAGAIGDLDG